MKRARSISSMTRVLVKDLWCLFRPGALVVSKPYLDELQLFRVSDCECKEGKDEKTFVLVAWASVGLGPSLCKNTTTPRPENTRRLTRRWQSLIYLAILFNTIKIAMGLIVPRLWKL